MTRTTLALDDALLQSLKERAAREGRPLHALTNDLLRLALAAEAGPPFRLKLEGWAADQQPGVSLFDRDQLFDLLDQDR